MYGNSDETKPQNKVTKFNSFQDHDDDHPFLKLSRNAQTLI